MSVHLPTVPITEASHLIDEALTTLWRVQKLLHEKASTLQDNLDVTREEDEGFEGDAFYATAFHGGDRDW